MILRRLYEYAQAHSDSMPQSGMECREIEYVVVIDSDGSFIRLESHRIDKTHCDQFQVAGAVTRTSGVQPNILWDNAKYALGVGDTKHKYHPSFVGVVNSILEVHPDDPAINALAKFLSYPTDEIIRLISSDLLGEELLAKPRTNISYRLDGDSELIAEKTYLFKHLLGVHNDAKIGTCLVTGKQGPIIRTSTATPLPFNSPMSSLVSVNINSGYDSYGKTQAYNSPISFEAEEAFSATLKKFLTKDSPNRVQLGTRTVFFWASGEPSITSKIESCLRATFMLADRKDPEYSQKITEGAFLLSQIVSGQIPSTPEDKVYILVGAPNIGRISVTVWHEGTVRELAERIRSLACDMLIGGIPGYDSERPFVSVGGILASVAGGKVSDLPPRVIDDTLRAVLSGNPLPVTLYTEALRKIKTGLPEKTPAMQLVAILRGFVNCTTGENLADTLDKGNTNPGYLCGRLAAVIEKMQENAKIGDSIRIQYTGTASVRPLAVFPTMLRQVLQYHMSEGSKTFYDKLMEEIIGKLPTDGFPANLNLADQGRFFVGYIQQRIELSIRKT